MRGSVGGGHGVIPEGGGWPLRGHIVYLESGRADFHQYGAVWHTEEGVQWTQLCEVGERGDAGALRRLGEA